MTMHNQPHDEQAKLQQLSHAFSEIPFNRMLGLTLTNISEQQICMHFPMKSELVGNFLLGILHGGVISSVLDMAGGMAAMSAAIYKYPDKTPEQLATIISNCSTVDLQISYLRPGRGEFFKATASLTKSGQTVLFARMELLNETEKLIATGCGTYLFTAV